VIAFLFHVLTLAAPLALVTIAKLAGLVSTGGSSGWNDGAVKTGLGDNVDLDGGVTARVVDGTCVDLGDRHDEGSSEWRRLVCVKREGMKLAH
jgi:hypothetical protein